MPHTACMHATPTHPHKMHACVLTPSTLGCMYAYIHCVCSVCVTFIQHAGSVLEVFVLACSIHVWGVREVCMLHAYCQFAVCVSAEVRHKFNLIFIFSQYSCQLRQSNGKGAASRSIEQWFKPPRELCMLRVCLQCMSGLHAANMFGVHVKCALMFLVCSRCVGGSYA
jgi:hypothetical protein